MLKYNNKYDSTSTSCDVLYSNDDPVEIAVGGINIGQTFDENTMTEMQDMLLYPERYPRLGNPSVTLRSSVSGFREIGEIIPNLDIIANFNRGYINPAYGTSGFRSGLPKEYNFLGKTVPDKIISNQLSNTQTISYEVIRGSTQQKCRVLFEGGEQPLTNKGRPYKKKLNSGYTNYSSCEIIGVYPFFATSKHISMLSKQKLASMSSTYVECVVEIEETDKKQTVDFPVLWKNITGIQFYNTVSGKQEQISGTKENSLRTFTKTSTQHEIHGNTIDYVRYIHNGSKTGYRSLRWYTN